MDQILVSGTKYTGGAAQKARPVSCNERGIKYWWEIANVRYHWMEPTFYSLLWRSFLCKLGFWPPNVGHNSGWFWGKIKNSLFQMIQALICDSSVLIEDDDNVQCTVTGGCAAHGVLNCRTKGRVLKDIPAVISMSPVAGTRVWG